MDGNNRWSKKNSKPLYEGYKKGALRIIEIATYIFDNYKTSHVSAFALSANNLKRSQHFLKIFRNVLNDLIDEYLNLKLNFRITFLGNINIFDEKTIKSFHKIQNQNKNLKKNLIIFINYSGKTDIINTLNKVNTISSKNINQLLTTKGIPDPEVLIRTGGFHRISDFMLYQLSFTELFFLKKLWPDLSFKDIGKIIDNYLKIERKFGI